MLGAVQPHLRSAYGSLSNWSLGGKTHGGWSLTWQGPVDLDEFMQLSGYFLCHYIIGSLEII